MTHTPLLKKILGDDWNTLPPVIRRHYESAAQGESCVCGTMEVTYPGWLKPLILLIHWCGGLIVERGANIRARVDKHQLADAAATLCWRRTLTGANGRQERFLSRMRYAGPNELVETVGLGFGLRLRVNAERGELVYRSDGYFWQKGSVRLTIPDWLLLGHATIVERPLSEDRFGLDFTIRHPCFGVTYRYRGAFTDCV